MNAHQAVFEHFREKDKRPSEADTRAAIDANRKARGNWWAKQLEQTRDMPALREDRDTQNWGMQ